MGDFRLVEMIEPMLDHIKDNSDFTKRNEDALDIYEGDLMRHLVRDMSASLSENYFQQIKTRLVPINILPKVVDKLSRLYHNAPIRTAELETDQELVDMYTDELSINSEFNVAEEYVNLHKGYSIEPFLSEIEKPDGSLSNKVKARVLPYDRFLPMNIDRTDKEKVDIFIKFMGDIIINVPDMRHASRTRSETRQLFFAYSNDEFLVFDSQGQIHDDMLPTAVDGTKSTDNPFGTIPMTYGNRARLKVIPTVDSDLLAMTKVMPIIYSDLSGATMFLCFSIIWGLDVNLEKAKMSPNAFWELKSDGNSDKQPQVGTLKPEVDSDKVLAMVKEIYLNWLDTKGLKAGAAGSLRVEDASGIAKAIDEMDAAEAHKESAKHFEKDEKDFWRRLATMHNYWVDQGKLVNINKFSEQFIEDSITIEYDPPKPKEDRSQVLENVLREFDRGIMSAEQVVKKLHPSWGETEIAEAILRMNEFNGVDDGETTEI